MNINSTAATAATNSTAALAGDRAGDSSPPTALASDQATPERIVRLEQMLEQVTRMIQEFHLAGGRPPAKTAATPTVTQGQIVGELPPTKARMVPLTATAIGGEGIANELGTAIHVEDVVGASRSEVDAKQMAQQYSREHGGEPVAIVRTYAPTSLGTSADGSPDVGAGIGDAVGGAADAAHAALQVHAGMQVVYNVVTLDPAIAPEHAYRLDASSALPLPQTDTAITWIIDDATMSRAGDRSWGNRSPGFPSPPKLPRPFPGQNEYPLQREPYGTTYELSTTPTVAITTANDGHDPG